MQAAYYDRTQGRTIVRGRSNRSCDQVTTYFKQPNRKVSQIRRATRRGGCGQVSRSKSVANSFLNMFSHIWSYDQDATYERPVEQPNRRGSQINHATSRGGSGQSHDQKHVRKPVAAISGRTQVLNSRTTVARPAMRLVVWSYDR